MTEMTRLHPACLALVAAATLAAVAPAARAQDAAGPTINWSATAATDYVWRGVSQTGGNPAVFGTVQISNNGFYAGAGAENVDFGEGTDAEYDLWAGWAGPVGGGFTLDAGLVRYGYVGAPDGSDYDTVEAKVALSHAVGQGTIGAVIMYTPDYFGVEDSALYYEANGSLPLSAGWSLSGAVAHQAISGSNGDYTTWNLGTGYALTRRVSLDLRYSDTDAHDFGSTYDATVIASIKIAI